MTEPAAMLIAPQGAGRLSLPYPARPLAPAQPWPATATLFALYATIALAFRLPLIGNPLVHVDEQFYLLVADRWAHGALPFVDIWDRKPIGLFLLYRLFLLVPIDPVLSYQIFGIISTAATALVIDRLARLIAPPPAARQAAVVYILAMPAFSCAFGQAPVFYNLLMALAALLLVRLWMRPDASTLLARGSAIMALVGIAMQLKYCVLFEGIAFGLVLLSRAWADGLNWRQIIGFGLTWVLVALTPTLLALAAFASIGQGEAFLQANFISIFQRLPDGPDAVVRLMNQTLALTPFWLAILLAPKLMSLQAPTDARAQMVLRLWAGAAVAGYLVFGTWYDHYVAPMLPPLCVLAAPVLARAIPAERWFGRLLLTASAVGGLTVMSLQLYHHGSSDEAAHMTRLIQQELRGGGFYMFDGDPAFYRTVDALIPTRYAFPSHLNTWTEAPAIGTDPAHEVARIMLSRPDVVLIGEWNEIYQPNWQSRAVVHDFLTHDYERYAGFTLGTHPFGLYRPRSR